jgi:hypothetical protein
MVQIVSLVRQVTQSTPKQRRIKKHFIVGCTKVFNGV